MADNNTAMPSEDEDFDAVHTGGPIMADNFDDKPAEDKPAGTSVKIITDDNEPEEDEQPAESEADSSQEATALAEETSHEESPADEPAESVSEESEEPANEPEDSKAEEAVAEPELVAAETTPAPAISEGVVKESKPPKAPRSGGSGLARNILDIVLMVAVIGLGLWSWQLYSDKKDLNNKLNQAQTNPSAIIQKQTQDLISKVSQLYNVPKDETPTIANVTDASQAKQQSAFFNDAKNGDKVLMYVKTGIAILYRPSTNKIVLVAPLTFTGTGNTSTSTTPAGTNNTSSSR